MISGGSKITSPSHSSLQRRGLDTSIQKALSHCIHFQAKQFGQSAVLDTLLGKRYQRLLCGGSAMANTTYLGTARLTYAPLQVETAHQFSRKLGPHCLESFPGQRTSCVQIIFVIILADMSLRSSLSAQRKEQTRTRIATSGTCTSIWTAMRPTALVTRVSRSAFHFYT
jgi:hypothetical protein